MFIATSDWPLATGNILPEAKSQKLAAKKLKKMKTVKKRFLKYVQIDTTADPNSTTFPSSMKQKDLSKILLQ